MAVPAQTISFLYQHKQALELAWVVGPFPSALEGPTSPTGPQLFHRYEGTILGC